MYFLSFILFERIIEDILKRGVYLKNYKYSSVQQLYMYTIMPQSISFKINDKKKKKKKVPNDFFVVALNAAHIDKTNTDFLQAGGAFLESFYDVNTARKIYYFG